MQGFDSATRLRYTCTYGTYAESCGLERVPALEEKFGSICLIELVRMIRMCQSNEKYPKTIQRPSKTIQNLSNQSMSCKETHLAQTEAILQRSRGSDLKHLDHQQVSQVGISCVYGPSSLQVTILPRTRSHHSISFLVSFLEFGNCDARSC